MKASEKQRQLFPENFEQEHNVLILPTKATSVEAYYQRWLHQHRFNFIEIAAMDDRYQNVDLGKVLVKAALGGDEDATVGYWMVDAKHYHNERTEFGYIINLSRDDEREILPD